MIDPDKHYDPLLECLVIFSRLHGRPIGVEALITGLPVEPGADGPELFSIDHPKGLFSRVAARAGFASRLIRRDLDKLSRLLLPCILVLKNGNACVLESIDRVRIIGTAEKKTAVLSFVIDGIQAARLCQELNELFAEPESLR